MNKENLIDEVTKELTSWWCNGPALGIKGESEEIEYINSDDEKHKKLVVQQLNHIAESTEEELDDVLTEVLEDILDDHKVIEKN